MAKPLLPLLLVLALVAAALGFVPPAPTNGGITRSKKGHLTRVSALSPADVVEAASSLNSLVLTVADAAADAEYEYGAVAAPGTFVCACVCFTLLACSAGVGGSWWLWYLTSPQAPAGG